MGEKLLDFVQLLPMELVEEICLYLEPRDLASCTSVSTTWREALNSNKIWGYHCEKRGWKEDLDPHFSHFCKAHKQFQNWTHSYDSFSPICQKRLLFNKWSCLQKNWKSGQHIVNKLSVGPSSFFELFEPMACDGKYLVMLEKSLLRTSATVLAVWRLDGIPSRVCTLPLKSSVHPVESIAFDYETIAVLQNWIVTVYTLNKVNFIFEMAYEISDLDKLAPKEKQHLKDNKLTSYLKVTKEVIIYVPSLSHSSENYLPIMFWQRSSGKLLNELKFDSMYYAITNAVWFHDSCYLSLSNKETKSHQIVEFSSKTKTWEFFSQNVILKIEQILVSSLYILGVTKPTDNSFQNLFPFQDDTNKQIWFWNRTTGTPLKKPVVAFGKGFQLVGNYLMVYDTSRVWVIDPKTTGLFSYLNVGGIISSAKPCTHSSLMVIIKTGCYIEVWDWELGTRLYTVTPDIDYGSQIWCDDKQIITYHLNDSFFQQQSREIMIVGFW